MILARDDVSSDDVYKFVADIFDNAASLTTSHAKYGELSLEYGASITSVPYHPALPSTSPRRALRSHP